MAKEEKTLSEEDKKRIEQEATRLVRRWQNDDNTIKDVLIEIAEYEHKYQREQQTKKPPEKFMQVHSGSFSCKTRVPSKVPYKLLSEQMAQKNHGQTLDRLNERGGMGVLEILDNIHSRRLSFSEKETQAHVDELNKLINDAEAECNELRNKVIEEAVESLATNEYFRQNLFEVNLMKTLLNSLKSRPVK